MTPSFSVDLFQSTFLDVQRRFGLMHYCVTFSDVQLPDIYADIYVEAEDCIATVRYDSARCSLEGVTEATAIHEVLHLLLADFKHATKSSARVEEERLVRRLEPVVIRGIEAGG